MIRMIQEFKISFEEKFLIFIRTIISNFQYVSNCLQIFIGFDENLRLLDSFQRPWFFSFSWNNFWLQQEQILSEWLTVWNFLDFRIIVSNFQHGSNCLWVLMKISGISQKLFTEYFFHFRTIILNQKYASSHPQISWSLKCLCFKKFTFLRLEKLMV